MDHSRRKFLKFLALGGGVGIVAKIFGSDFINFFSQEKNTVISTKNIGGFQIVEKDSGLSISSEEGREIFVIDNER